jgi:hypothetical protein
MALATRFDAALPYFRLPEDFRAAILDPPTPVVDTPENIPVRLAHVVPEKAGVSEPPFAFLQPS